jgi:hypothetical protein
MFQHPFTYVALSLMAFTGCQASYSPLPKPGPLYLPGNPAQLNALPKHFKPISTTAVLTASRAKDKKLTGVVTRKGLADWLIAHDSQIKLPKQPMGNTPAKPFDDMPDTAFSQHVLSRAWQLVFFPRGVGRMFFPNAPVNREQFCVLACLMAGQYKALSSVSPEIINSYAPPQGKPFSLIADNLHITPEARASVAWAYKEALLSEAFGLDADTLQNKGLSPALPVQWPEVLPPLFLLLQPENTR